MGKKKTRKPQIAKPPPAEVQADIYRAGRTIMLGFTGSIGSGCTFLSEGLRDSLGSDGHYYRLSRYIYESLRDQGIHVPTTAQLQNEGNRLRKERGLQYLVERCSEDITQDEEAGKFNENSVILIDGLRNTGEVQTLRTMSNFYLISVHADRDTRKDRLVGTGKRFAAAGDFDVADRRDFEEGDMAWGQKVQLCNDAADIIVNNEDALTKGTAERERFFSHFKTRYLTVMRAIRNGAYVPDAAPSIDEVLMTMAFCASRRSSCMKRKVGAVVAYIRQFESLAGKVKRLEDDKRYQVISSGHNEVPLGTPPCRLSPDEECYRDAAKWGISALFKHCPSCGKELPADVADDYDRIAEYSCECGVGLKECLPGTGEKRGRLLDMCRALHAEENAILGLSGTCKSGDGELVLYTTTFPCNLCANKIVEAGIKTVVYAEPYPMKEAKEILRLGGVTPKKFEGVKSTAYFRIYPS
ncbi:MAG: hypothetical protein ISS74_10250 [Planctomycetes bacterium]|nr:hypothetical protein [Planctomycetota bacterium]